MVDLRQVRRLLAVCVISHLRQWEMPISSEPAELGSSQGIKIPEARRVWREDSRDTWVYIPAWAEASW